MDTKQIDQLILKILNAAAQRPNDPDGAVRLFNGFYEGFPELSADRYADTIVLHSFAKSGLPETLISGLLSAFRSLTGIRNILLKKHFAEASEAHNGVYLHGGQSTDRIREFGVEYPIDLTLNRDCSFYLDAAHLRETLIQSSAGKSVLNTFAYTGSLGLASLAGNARCVVQTDRNPAFLRLADDEARRQGIPSKRYQSIAADFFALMTRLRKEERLFDTVILDPPFFSKTARGRVDQQSAFLALINKIRPLVADGGTLITVNNALYLSGMDFIAKLASELPRDYISLGEPIPVPQSFIGYDVRAANLPADPAPFNHPTKILPLYVRRKDGRSAAN